MDLRGLFGRREAARPGSIPVGEAVYAVGDIHGRFDLLQDLLTRIYEDASRHPSDSSRSLIFLGDYIDRGSESSSVVEALRRDPLPDFATVRLKGNHEEAFLAFLDGRTDGLDWLAFGGLETLMSYGVSLRHLPRTDDAVGALRQSVAASVPPGHVELMRRCKLHHSVGDYLFVHAGVRPGVPLEAQRPVDLMWIRDDFLRSKIPLPQRVVVHGHTICDFPQDRPHRINIDTGAFASGRLTCLVLRGAGRRFISTADT
ncbi:MAG: serine/threonine protein phosphatase [Proteobacteria bacterium]|nr:serine/threonine protein phosphatase [Pseudomonadota bacterium]